MNKTVKPAGKPKTAVWPKFRKWIFENRYYIYAFFIPVIIMALAYGLFDVYPLGNIMGTKFSGRPNPHDGSVLVLDFNGQYVYYYEVLRDAIWGDGSILYNWSRNLSGEYIGIIGYYLASPFTLIVMLLPRTIILESLLIMQLAKIGTIGVTFSYYLQKSKKMKPLNSLIFSSLFALCAYAVIQLMDPMWIDGLVFLPLIMLGIEYLVDRKLRAYYIIPLAMMFFANFYIGYMIAIFSVLYFIFYFIFGTNQENRSWKDMGFTILRFGYCSAIAGACAAIMILPVYHALSLGKFEFTTPDYSLKLQFDSIDIISKLLPSSYDTVRNEGLPEIYCGTISMLLLPLFFFNSKIETKKKIGYALLLAAMFFSMYIKPIDMWWHGGQVPNWLPYRYSFIMSWIILVMAAQAFEKLDGVKANAIGGTFFGILVYLLMAEKLFKYENIEVLNGLWFTAGCILCFSILVSAYRESSGSKVIPLTILLIVSGELLLNSFDTLKAIDKDVAYSTRSSYYDKIQTGRDAVAVMEEKDPGLYRSEKIAVKNACRRTLNDNMAWGLKGLSHSSSVMNSKIIDTLGKLGFCNGGFLTRYNGTTPLTDSILGIKYVMDSENAGVDPSYPYQYSTRTEHKDGSTDQIDVYQNMNALSIGYMVDKDIENAYISNPDNPFENQNALLSAMLGEEKEYFKRLNFSQDPIYSNVTIENAGDQTKYVANAGANDWTIDYFVHAETNDPVFIFFPTVYQKKINLWRGVWNDAEGKFDFPQEDYLGNYFEGEDYCIKRLGKYDANTNFCLRATVANEYTYMKDQLFYYFDEAAFNADMEKLKQNQLDIEKWSDTHIKGTVTANEGQMFFTSIPYEKGWTVRVDGKKAEIKDVAGGFIAVDMDPGTHKVSMSFFPAGMPLGIVLTITGIGLVAVFILIDSKKGFSFRKKVSSSKS